ncbi:MAG: efflux transporter outer membrane subunit [Spirochaetota bacterium]
MIFRNKVLFFYMILVMFFLFGCVTVGPDYVKPEVSSPAGWNNQLIKDSEDKKNNTNSLAEWWKTINDPILSSLIERAVAGNLDVKNAVAKVREARANRGIEEAGYYPAVDATGSATRERNKNLKQGSNTNQNLYSTGIDASWEIDLFGGVRRSVEAATATLQARDEDLRNTLVSLLGELTLNYIDVRTYQARIRVAEGNLAAQAETYQLTLWMKEADLSDQLAVEQARYSLESTRSKIPALRIGLEKAMNRISVLIGEQPGKLRGELNKEEPVPVVSPEITIGVPAEVLRNRPDIRSAERELAAQTAKIGVATAELYPKFTLGGSIGLEATTGISSSSTGLVLSGGPSISWGIFRAGAIRQNIKVQTALQEQALIKYEATVLGALEEVENALKAFAEEQQRKSSLGGTVQAAVKAVELAQYKYKAGLTDFNSVLEAQRSLLSYQDELAQSEGTVVYNLVSLYKALGGGWKSFAPEENNINKTKSTTNDGDKNEK